MMVYAWLPRMNKRVRGFTLLEIAIVLVVLGLIAAGLVGPLATQMEARERRDTAARLTDIQAALYGFALSEGRLPCPDTDGDGLSNPRFDPAIADSARCAQTTGTVPYSEIGTGESDVWGNRYTYAVSQPDYTRPDTDDLCNGGDADGPHFDLCTRGRLVVRSRGDAPATRGVVEGKAELATWAVALPAVVISHGRNGAGATRASGGALPVDTQTDEGENADGDTVFVSRSPTVGAAICRDDTDENSPLCAFDDQVIWVVPTILQARMVGAGRLP